jgi:tetratricopeptide (TPR) repeat protein
MDNTTSIRNPWKRELSEKYDLTEVIGSFEALTRLKNAVYSAVIVNISLSELKGVDAIGKIRDKWPDLPIFVIYETKDLLGLKQALTYKIRNSFPAPVDSINLLAALSQVNSNNKQAAALGKLLREDDSENDMVRTTQKGPSNGKQQVATKESQTDYIDIESLFYDGLSAIAANELEKAIKIYKDIITVTNIKREKWLHYVEESFFHLGQCHARLKDYAKSNKYYADFITRAPHHNSVKEALLYLGRNHEAMRDLDRASNYYRKVMNMQTFDAFSTQAKKFLSKISKS